jgi:hypothetical protein
MVGKRRNLRFWNRDRNGIEKQKTNWKGRKDLAGIGGITL